MSRWSQYDEDDYRLPSGMKRVGYDAESQTYTFQDSDGTYWEGNPGERYGHMHQVDYNTHEPTTPSYRPRYKDNSWRYLAPFFLLIGFSLLVVYSLLGGYRMFIPGQAAVEVKCPEKQTMYFVRRGDTCWNISKSRDMSLQQLESMNNDIDCDKLRVGYGLCVKDLTVPKHDEIYDKTKQESDHHQSDKKHDN